MASDEIRAARAEALGLLHRALALMDRHGFGVAAAPHVDLGAHLLGVERERADDRATDAG